MADNTMEFKKRFTPMSILNKMDAARQLQQLIANGRRLDGDDMEDHEKLELSALLHWCHENTFYNTRPDGSNGNVRR